ncbi:YheC/YheD family protein [Paenibacillus sp. NEAU-GSW1]|uniref:YheC/YheD family endospore coat-associated protein n=1 Tax=Paenibacillus sp. NEAU-GSW1 TaxID=2682486 RepID=UPI0012E2C97D|nr:YheC/YheD family protein [Paenibacillus sp. NEAU-GSW1]MUT64454.1 YheC/YheD family protein [Paenibacillus sp. NEAU-GSW1]
MLKSKVAVQVISSGMIPEDTLMLGEGWLKQWKIPEGQPVVLKMGSFRQHVKVISVAKYDGMRISQSLAKKMGILANTPLRLQYKAGSSTLTLGPLIGVLVSRDYPAAPDKPFGSITMFCRELVDGCANQGGLVYFFTPNHIGMQSDSVEGWVYADGWRKIAMPAPDVVNNRLTSRKLENKPNVQQFLKEIKQKYGTSVFNEKFLDKTEVFDALKKDSSLSRYLPESHLLRNYTTLKAMSARYENVFLKPVRGSLGKGIIRVSRSESGAYQAMFTTANGSRKQQFPSLLKLYATISTKMKSVRYQIQQGLQLIEIQKRPVDFRALVQKNGSGKWSITSIVARTAGSQHFVSNLARGGTLSKVGEAVSKSNMSSGRGDASSRLQQAALSIAKGVETHIPAHFGELGIDLALDSGGRVWLLEVNSKPSKNDNTPLTDNKIRPSVRMVIQYSRYLSGF